MKRPREVCPDCGQTVPLCKDGTPVVHTVGQGPYAPGESRPTCTRHEAKARRTQAALEAAKARYFGSTLT